MYKITIFTETVKLRGEVPTLQEAYSAVKRIPHYWQIEYPDGTITSSED